MIMNKKNKRIIMLGTLSLAGITFIMIAGKMTPQWLEFQELSRATYLLFSFVFLTIGMIFLIKPIKYMIMGTQNE